MAENEKSKTQFYQYLLYANFKSLKENQFLKDTYSSRIDSLSNNFDSTLYSELLLKLLNQDKIVMIDSFWIKVDLDNEFCIALDAKIYPNEINDLKANNFNNNHLMIFLNPDEPVLDCLEKIRERSITWTEYQDSLARKGGQGICLKRGKPTTTDIKKDTYIGNLGNSREFITTAAYFRGFIHFELRAEGNCTFAADPTKIRGDYNWEGVCKNSGSGKFYQESTNVAIGGQNGATNYQNIFRAYSGGSALKTIKINVQTTAPNNTLGQIASIQ